MKDKNKNLKKLLEMKKKKKDPNAASAPKEDEEATQSAAGADIPASAEAGSPEPPSASSANQAGPDDSESDDELKGSMAVGGVKIVGAQGKSSQQQEVVEAEWLKPKDDKDEGAQEKEKKPKRNNASNIQFGKPTFSRRPNAGILNGAEDIGLDELDDSGQQKKSHKNKNTAADGGREFQNIGSTPVDRNKKFEEEKEKEKAAPQRPRFTGKAKIGGGASQQTTGQNTLYDMSVKYKTHNPENADGKKSHEKKEDGQPEVRTDKRKINKDKGPPRFGAKDQGLDDSDDEGFEIVRDPNQKRRQQRVLNRAAKDEDRDGDEGPKTQAPASGTVIKRGGAFGNLGGNDSD